MAWRPAPGHRCGRGVRRWNYCASPSLRSCTSDQERESFWPCQHVSLTQAQQQHNDDDDPISGDPIVSLATTATNCSKWNLPSPPVRNWGPLCETLLLFHVCKQLTYKIRRKWYKNRKMSNEDVMESLWVDLCSMCIILYVLIEKSCFRLLPILDRVKFISVDCTVPIAMNYNSFI
jgi:hypothetical protein